MLNAGSIAPLHKSCADRSSVQCPHLSGDPDLDLIAFPDRWLVAPLLVEAQTAAPESAILARPAGPVPIVAFLQLVGIMPEVRQAVRNRRRD